MEGDGGREGGKEGGVLRRWRELGEGGKEAIREVGTSTLGQ
jgi:hypothetical protein